ncbi:Chitinase 2 [Emydomyces testavorans]|uniref:chitinase n=1 Tax=Emydomyces testavorans TaxID=2070801 RepID=A0AAF0DKU5_9EURO|nr:Chitinase 2 [Emydomyces testavorans]
MAKALETLPSSPSATTVIVFQLAFVTLINGIGGAPQVNFANQGDSCTTFPGTDLLNCPQIGADITKCQSKGKTILLSIGGATYSEGGFRTEEAAIAGADLIWETFGPRKAGSTRPRPFGDAVVDGFDFDFEANVFNMVPFANRLRSLMAADASKKYYLTIAPQCPYPDFYNKDLLDGNVDFDGVFIQFYNNYCGLDKFQPDVAQQSSFNLDTWDNWAKTVSKNKNVKVFVGAPANQRAAGSGYVDASRLAQVIRYSKGFSSFGGVMLWDASQAYANGNFITAIKAALGTASRAFRF